MTPPKHAVLVTASILLAQVVADCNISGNYTIIDAPKDDESISTCKSIDGSLSLLFNTAPDAWGSEASVDLGEVASVGGDLTIYPTDKPKKTIVTGQSLKTVEGGLTISLTGSTTGTIDELDISFPVLEEVHSDYVISGTYNKLSIDHSASVVVDGLMRVADLVGGDFSLGGISTVKKDFSIDSNPNLGSVEVAALTTVGKGFDLKTNSELSKASFPQLKTVTGDVTIYQNGALTEFALPALESAGTLSFTSNGADGSLYLPKLSSLGSGNESATSNFDSISLVQFASLRTVKGALSFQSTSLKDLTIPLVKSIDGSITVESNPSMTTFALPRISEITDIFIKDNDKLTNFTANALKKVHSISIQGSLTNVEFFGLEEVSGDFKVAGASSMDCSWFEDNLKKIIKGTFSCVGNHDKTDRKSSTGGIENTEGNPEDYMTDLPNDGDNSGDGGSKNGGGKNGKGGDGTSSGGGGGGGGLSKGAQAGIGVGVSIAGLLIIALIFWYLRRKKRNDGSIQISDSPSPIGRPMSEVGGLGGMSGSSGPSLAMEGEKHVVVSSSDEDIGGSYNQGAGAAGINKRASGSGGHNSRSSIYEGDQMLGVYTTIEAGEPSSSAAAGDNIGTLNFGRVSLLSAASKRLSDKGMGAWKTIRRVSVSSAGDAASNSNSHGSGSRYSNDG